MHLHNLQTDNAITQLQISTMRGCELSYNCLLNTIKHWKSRMGCVFEDKPDHSQSCSFLYSCQMLGSGHRHIDGYRTR